MKYFIPIALLVAWLFGSGIASAGPVIDQQFIPTDISEATVQPIAEGPSYGQTFTVGLSGQLAGADLALDAGLPGRTLNDVLVEVTTTLGGLPTATVLATGTIPGRASHYSTLPYYSPMLISRLLPPVTAGQQLALLFFGNGDLGH